MFARRLRNFRRDARGATAVEFAFCLPVFLMMVLGTIQFGWTQHTFSSVRYAMERASRALVLDPDTTQATLQSLVTAQLAKGTSANVTVALSKATVGTQEIATFQTTYTAQFGIPGVRTFSIPYTVIKKVPLRDS